MSSSYASLNYHAVFSTKYRRANLIEPLRKELYAYMAGIIANKGGQLIEIGGTSDHVHLLTSCPATIALADFMRDLKANSSKWLREDKQQKTFQWQTGYGVFTVSCSQKVSVRRYITGQEDHHRRLTFEAEFRTMLERHGIAYTDEYLFEREHHG